MHGHTVTGHLTGSPKDTEEAMRFAVLHGVRPMVEQMPLEQANDGIVRVATGQARFRVVLSTTGRRPTTATTM